MKKYTIAAANLKGKSFGHTLNGINVVRGGNWSGKTTIITALKLALIGYDPKLGKRPGDTAKLMTGDTMSVALKGAGFEVDRKWKRTPTGATLKSEGDDNIAPSILLDIGEWFAMTGAQRRSYVLQAFGGGKIEDIDTSITERLQVMEPATIYPETLTEKSHLLELNEYWCGERDHNELPVAEWFDAQIKAVKERIKTWGDTVARTTAVIEQIQNERINNPTGLPASLESKLIEASKRLAELHKESGIVAAANRDIESQRAALMRAGDIPANLDELIEQNGKALEISINNEKLIGGRMAALGNPETKFAAMTRKRESLEMKISQLSGLMTELEAESAKDIPMPVCCKKCDPIVRAFLLSDLNKRADEVQASIAKDKEELTRLVLESHALGKSVEHFNQLKAELSEAQSLSGELVASGQLLAHKAKMRNATQVEKPEGLRTAEAISEDIGRVSIEIKTMEASELKRAHLLRRDRDEATALNEKDTAVRSLEVDKLAVVIFEDEQKNYVSRAFDPLVSILAKFTNGLLPFEISHRDGELGYVGPRNQWVSHATFSGAESAITYAGLGVALATKCRMKIVMLDELLVSADNKLAIASRMEQLIRDGVIDLFVAVDTTSDKWSDAENTINV